MHSYYYCSYPLLLCWPNKLQQPLSPVVPKQLLQPMSSRGPRRRAATPTLRDFLRRPDERQTVDHRLRRSGGRPDSARQSRSGPRHCEARCSRSGLKFRCEKLKHCSATQNSAPAILMKPPRPMPPLSSWTNAPPARISALAASKASTPGTLTNRSNMPLRTASPPPTPTSAKSPLRLSLPLCTPRAFAIFWPLPPTFRPPTASVWNSRPCCSKPGPSAGQHRWTAPSYRSRRSSSTASKPATTRFEESRPEVQAQSTSNFDSTRRRHRPFRQRC